VPASLVERAKTHARIDTSPAHRPPKAAALAVATVLSVGLSLAADALLVALGKAVFPSTSGYVHFRFGDYSKLTVIGVIVACAAWPIVTRLTAAPRWVFVRLAVLVTLVLLLPDLAILVQGQPGRAVAVLVCMHIAIGVVTYNLLVRVAPPQPAVASART
jgi:hypothetical protein